MTHTRRLVTSCYVLGAGLLAITGCEKPQETAEIVRPARVIRIAEPLELNERSLPGRAAPVEEVNLSFDVPGTILERPASVGDEVTRGQLLARLDARDYQNELDASLAARDRAKANYERIEYAARSGAVSRQDLDDAIAQLEVREADVRIKQKAVEDTVIVAPRDGVISATYVEAYTSVRAKEPVVRLLDTSSIEMIVQVPENLISQVSNIQSAWVEYDAFPGQRVPAQIKEIGNEASLTTRTYPVKLIMAQPQDFEIVPGMAGRVTASLKAAAASETRAHQLPMTAIFTSNLMEESGKSFVWVVDESSNTVHRREVVTGKLTRYGIAVSEGIETGDLVVISGVNTLREGQEVRPALTSGSA